MMKIFYVIYIFEWRARCRLKIVINIFGSKFAETEVLAYLAIGQVSLYGGTASIIHPSTFPVKDYSRTAEQNS